jgi:alpha-tubulin suppressor-like RCC1 family protein
MNVTNLVLQLVRKQNEATDPMDFALLGKAIEQLKLSNVFVVNYIEGLPNPVGITQGTLYYVRTEKALYYVKNNVWINLSYKNTSNIKTFGDFAFGILGHFCDTQDTDSKMFTLYSPFSDWCQVSSGAAHTAAVGQNGTLWTWGLGTCGRLGDGTTIDKSSPVSVVGEFTDWCQVSAGCQHTAAVRQNGTLWAWGLGSSGRLGDGTTTNKTSPVTPLGDFTDWCQVAAGCNHTAAVRQNGTLWTWGDGGQGRLGNNCGANQSSPVSVVGDFTDWCQVSAGDSHTSAVRTNGTLWTWGNNQYGMLGNNCNTQQSSPVSVIGGFTDWCQVSAGNQHTAAVRTNGTLWSWGRNTCGRLGDNTTVDKSSPVSVVGGFTDWCQVSAGCNHTAAVRQNGTLYGWGSGLCNKLGELPTGCTLSPALMVSCISDWCQVSAGTAHTAAVRLQVN